MWDTSCTEPAVGAGSAPDMTLVAPSSICLVVAGACGRTVCGASRLRVASAAVPADLRSHLTSSLLAHLVPGGGGGRRG